MSSMYLDFSNNLYDYFRNRIIFPIFDQYNKVRAFGARIITNDDKTAKYLNSQESELYQKRDILYGFNLAKNEIREINTIPKHQTLISLYDVNDFELY